jgi:hypothetical protein
MILFVHFVVAFFVALILSLIFVRGFRRAGPWASFLAFFIIVFLASWAGGLWLRPLGTALWGVYWLPFLMVGLIFALVIAAASIPSRPTRPSVELAQKDEVEISEAKTTLTALGLFFYIVIIALAVSIISQYV